MLEITKDTDVYTADGEHVGSVDRIVIDPLSRQLTHLVVRKGILFTEDKLIWFEDISTATPERINLRQDVEVDDLPPFERQYYVPMHEADRRGSPEAKLPAFAATWYGPLGIEGPTRQDPLVAVQERNIPDRLTALEAGLPVFSSDHEIVGRLRRVTADDAGMPTEIVLEPSGLSPDRRSVPIAWVKDITEEAIALAATARQVEAIVPLGPDG
jgi:sporulation protein YlmC with PRC-barrel domain